jgi:hypothetical protein
VALDIDASVMNSFSVCAVTGLATSDLADHTHVIHPHCV